MHTKKIMTGPPLIEPHELKKRYIYLIFFSIIKKQNTDQSIFLQTYSSVPRHEKSTIDIY